MMYQGIRPCFAFSGGVLIVYYNFIDMKASSDEQHQAAHRLLDEAVKRLYGIEKYSLVRGERGKPFFREYPDIFFNLSHCRGLVVCAVSDCENGADAELVRPCSKNAAKRIFTGNEMRFVSDSADPDESFFRIWTLKEAVGKALGTGIFSNLKNYEFRFENGIPVCEALPGKIFTQKILSEKWVVSVCGDSTENVFERLDV